MTPSRRWRRPQASPSSCNSIGICPSPSTSPASHQKQPGNKGRTRHLREASACHRLGRRWQPRASSRRAPGDADQPFTPHAGRQDAPTPDGLQLERSTTMLSRPQASCETFIRISQDERWKLDLKTRQCFFLGYIWRWLVWLQVFWFNRKGGC